VAERRPALARRAFEEVLRQQADQPQALYGRALVLDRQGQPDEALPLYDRALELSPGFVEARRFRARLLARQGRLRAAGVDVNECLRQEPRRGATLYAAACVAAIIAGKTASPAESREAADQAVELLRLAFAQGYGRDRAATDHDLDSLADHPGFRKLVPRP
jgi:tetratricopeptide (TPR) repeat protein